MKERPILMQGWGVRATLDDKKSQTRRVAKLGLWPIFEKSAEVNGCVALNLMDGDIVCPYGQPGDLLYFKETWCNAESCGFDARADGGEYWYRATDEGQCMGPWKPSIFMPKAAARIWRRVTDTRVERVQDISEADQKAEGVIRPSVWYINNNKRTAFGMVWDDINKKPKLSKRNPWTRALEDCYVSYPWEDIQETRVHRGLAWYVIGNPYVWALSHEKVDR